VAHCLLEGGLDEILGELLVTREQIRRAEEGVPAGRDESAELGVLQCLHEKSLSCC
jgi:hypothetical protein